MEEIWKDIDGFPGYQASSQGRIRSFRDFNGNITNSFRILKPRINKDGYYELSLYNVDHKKVTKRIHRLIATTFLENKSNLVVNHINGCKLDNRISNLELVTSERNSTLASESGLYKTKPIRIKETGEIFRSIKDCAKNIKVHPSDISHVISGTKESVKGFSFEYLKDDSKTKHKHFLRDYQYDAVNRMFNGCILNGGVGSGKSRTGLYYYFTKNGGKIEPFYKPMKHNSPDLYIITTAKKRNDLEWETEMAPFLLSTKADKNVINGNKIVVDSWQNVKKYADVKNAQFIFDEDKVTGYGVWVKAFLKIAKSNEWIILSATSGDTWSDYIPVFIANGFYKNKTEFTREHIVYSHFTKFPKIDRYVNTGKLIRLRNQILVDMDFKRETIAHHEDVYVKYDISKYKDAGRLRWDPFKDEPITNASGLCYVWRKIVNTDESRQIALLEIFEKHPRIIVFYNFDYELEILKGLYYGDNVDIAEWNGHVHQPVPDSEQWVYLVQYNAGAEGWNCIRTDTIVFYSQNYSYKVMHQSSGRIDRLNTPYKDLYYYHLKSRSGIDLAISKALAAKKNFNESKFVNR